MTGAFGISTNTLFPILATKMPMKKICYSGGNGVCWNTATAVKDLYGTPDNAYSGYPQAMFRDESFISVVNFNSQCATAYGTYGNIECFQMAWDINGFKGPNVYGRDIFAMAVTKNGLQPAGVVRHAGTCSHNYHINRKQGIGCTQFVLTNTDY